MSEQLKYEARGVSASKSEVHAAIKGLDKGLYPNAFCKILPDVLAGSDKHCVIMHADTAGTKGSLAYLYWKESKDLSVWKGIAQDAIVMNLDDMACAGMVDGIVLSSTVGRNARIITGDVIAAIIQGAAQLISEWAEQGVHMLSAGGETADVGDIVRTIDVGFTATGRMERSEVVDIDIKPGMVIVGLSSSGKASYETEYNSGIGSNGLTSARHDVLSSYYKQYHPESFDPAMNDDVSYTGNRRLTDIVSTMHGSFTVGQLLLSPTRTYLPVMKPILGQLRDTIGGIIHCTGGAQTKVLKFAEGVHIIKDNLFETPPVFDLIREEGQTSWREMYQVFNMGHRMEFYTDAKTAQSIIDIAAQFDIEGKVVGRVEGSEETYLTIKSPYGTFEYRDA